MIILSVWTTLLLAARRSANEGSAISACRTLHGAQMTYASSFGNGNYAGAIGAATTQALADLGTPGALIIDNTLDTGVKSGYNLAGGRVASAVGVMPQFFFTLNPAVTSGVTQTGARRFGIATDGVIMADATAANLATLYTQATVATATPLSN